MSHTSHYKNLKVWQKSIDFIEKIYTLLGTFPKTEQYWLSDQLRRASISIASNIAEWSWRGSEQEYIRFLYIAKWSAQEVETQLIIAQRLGYISEQEYNEYEILITDIIKMIAGLISHKKSL